MSAVHQVVPSFAARDAVGGHTLAVQRLLRELGHESDIFTIHAAADVRHLARPLKDLPAPAPSTAVVYQCSVGSPAADLLCGRAAGGETLVVDYHNLTPVELVAPWDGDLGYALAWGRRQLAALAGVAALGIGDSTVNAEDLAAAGFTRTAVAPVIVDPAGWPGPDPATAQRLRATKRGTDWLFVGRVVPNKAQHDVLRAFAWYHAVHDAGARLHLVGSPATASYVAAIEQAVDALGLADAVHLTGSLPDDALAAHYREADVFVCLSDHEGFCVPLLEAMHHELPIVAYASSAVPETLGGAGLLLPAKEPALVAAAVARVAGDAGLRARMVDAGRRRLADLGPERSRTAMATALASTLERLP
ncbi:MAG TPA: glycosyltransferase family 4 protein [Acidimicrobiales bacterium]